MRPTAERFADKFVPCPMSGCWLWTATTIRSGYGRLKVDGAFQLAHRVSWVLHRGPIPENTLVLHKCDVRLCVNPAHLFLGSHQNNSDDKFAKGRQRYLSGFDHPQARIDAAQVAAMRHLHDQGVSYKNIARQFGVSSSSAQRVVYNNIHSEAR